MATKKSTLDSDGNPLVPGAMYCEATISEQDGGEKIYGRLIRFGGVFQGKEIFFDADTGHEVDPDFDELVLQIGGIDEGFICVGVDASLIDGAV